MRKSPRFVEETIGNVVEEYSVGCTENENVALLKLVNFARLRHQMGGVFTRILPALRKLLCLRGRGEKTNDGQCDPHRAHDPFPPLCQRTINQSYFILTPRWIETILPTAWI